MRPWIIPLALTVSLTLPFPLAHAQTAEGTQVTAEALFDEGRRLMELGQYASACTKFRESQRLDAAAGTLMNLGLCYAKQGLSASAWASYQQAADLARAAGRGDRERVAQREIAALELELAKVTIGVAPEVRSLEPKLTLDGVELAAERWDVATPIDPGEHEIRASVPDGRTWSLRFSVAARELKSIRVPALEPAVASKPLPRAAPAHSAPARRKPSAVVEQGPAPKKSPSTAFWISAGTGFSSLAVGTVAGIFSLNSYETAESLCVNHRNCSGEAVSVADRADRQANVANVAFGVALVAVAASIWFYVSDEPEPRRAR